MLDSETQTFQRAWLHGRPRYRDYLAHSADGTASGNTSAFGGVESVHFGVSRCVDRRRCAHLAGMHGAWRLLCRERLPFPRRGWLRVVPLKSVIIYFAQHFSQHMPQCRGSSLVASHHWTSRTWPCQVSRKRNFVLLLTGPAAP